MVYQVKDADDFNSKLTEAGSKLVVIDFYATWCGPCKMMSPVFDELGKEFTDVVFLKVDVDEVDDVAENFEINVMPTFIFMRNSEKVGEFAGAIAEKLKEAIRNHM